MRITNENNQHFIVDSSELLNNGYKASEYCNSNDVAHLVYMIQYIMLIKIYWSNNKTVIQYILGNLTYKW